MLFNRADFVAHPFTEDPLVERPAIQLFPELGWGALPALAWVCKRRTA